MTREFDEQRDDYEFGRAQAALDHDLVNPFIQGGLELCVKHGPFEYTHIGQCPTCEEADYQAWKASQEWRESQPIIPIRRPNAA